MVFRVATNAIEGNDSHVIEPSYFSDWGWFWQRTDRRFSSRRDSSEEKFEPAAIFSARSTESRQPKDNEGAADRELARALINLRKEQVTRALKMIVFRIEQNQNFDATDVLSRPNKSDLWQKKSVRQLFF